MTQFNEQGYKDRMKTRGTPAEQQFISFAKKKGWHGAKYGFEQGIEHFWNVPEFVRSTPDFIVSHPQAMLVEVKGCGKDGIIKLKNRDLVALGSWDVYCDVHFFFYDSHRQRVSLQSLEDVTSVLHDLRVERGKYPDNGAEYFKIPVDLLKWENLA